MRILVCLLAGLGDAIMTSPMIRAIRQQRPDWTIHAITAMRATNSYVDALTELDHVEHEDFLDYPAEKKLVKLLRLRRRDYDYTILPYPSSRWQYHAGSIVMATGTLVSHTYSWWHRLIPGYAYTVPVRDDAHAVDLNAALLPGLGLSSAVSRDYSEPAGWNLPASTGRRRAAFHLMSLDSRINKGNERKAPPLTTVAAAARKLNERGFEIAVVGTAAERHIADEFAALAQCRVEFLTGTLEESGRQLRDCAVLISSDSGIAHLGASIGVPVVCIFGPTDPRHSAPIGDRVRIVRPSDCPPCFTLSDPQFTCKRGIDFACVREHVQPQHILDAVASLLPLSAASEVALPRIAG